MALGDDDASADTLQFIFIVCARLLCVCARVRVRLLFNSSPILLLAPISIVVRHSPLISLPIRSDGCVAFASFDCSAHMLDIDDTFSFVRVYNVMIFNKHIYTHGSAATCSPHSVIKKNQKKREEKKVVSTNCLLRTVVAHNVAALDVDVTFFSSLKIAAAIRANYTRYFHFYCYHYVFVVKKISVFTAQKIMFHFLRYDSRAWETHSCTQPLWLGRFVWILRQATLFTDWIRANGGTILLIIQNEEKKIREIPNKWIRWTKCALITVSAGVTDSHTDFFRKRKLQWVPRVRRNWIHLSSYERAWNESSRNL